MSFHVIFNTSILVDIPKGFRALELARRTFPDLTAEQLRNRVDMSGRHTSRATWTHADGRREVADFTFADLYVEAHQPRVEISEEVAREAGVFAEADEFTVYMPVGALNCCAVLEPIRADNLFRFEWKVSIDLNAVVRAWVDAGCPDRWNGPAAAAPKARRRKR